MCSITKAKRTQQGNLQNEDGLEVVVVIVVDVVQAVSPLEDFWMYSSALPIMMSLMRCAVNSWLFLFRICHINIPEMGANMEVIMILSKYGSDHDVGDCEGDLVEGEDDQDEVAVDPKVGELGRISDTSLVIFVNTR